MIISGVAAAIMLGLSASVPGADAFSFNAYEVYRCERPIANMGYGPDLHHEIWINDVDDYSQLQITHITIDKGNDRQPKVTHHPAYVAPQLQQNCNFVYVGNTNLMNIREMHSNSRLVISRPEIVVSRQTLS